MPPTIRRRGDVGLIGIEGPLAGAPGANELRAAVNNLFTDGVSRIVVDLREARFIDSLGLGGLLACKKEAITRGGDVRLVVRPGKVYGVLVDFSLDRLFRAFGDEASAVGSF